MQKKILVPTLLLSESEMSPDRLTTYLIWVILFLLALGWLGKSWAHQAPSGWEYDPWCCNHQDCRQLPEGDVNEVKGGWYVKSLDVFIPYTHPQLRVSGDEHFHLCELPKGTVRCFYVPPGGV